MWINADEWEKVQKRLEEIEKKVRRVESESRIHYDWEKWYGKNLLLAMPPSIACSTAIDLILKHLKLEIRKPPAVPTHEQLVAVKVDEKNKDAKAKP